MSVLRKPKKVAYKAKRTVTHSECLMELIVLRRSQMPSKLRHSLTPISNGVLHTIIWDLQNGLVADYERRLHQLADKHDIPWEELVRWHDYLGLPRMSTGKVHGNFKWRQPATAKQFADQWRKERGIIGVPIREND